MDLLDYSPSAPKIDDMFKIIVTFYLYTYCF